MEARKREMKKGIENMDLAFSRRGVRACEYNLIHVYIFIYKMAGLSLCFLLFLRRNYNIKITVDKVS